MSQSPFQPTHVLVSRSRQTPVQLVQSSQGFYLFTQSEWGHTQEPAFELYARRGFFCKGVQVVGYRLEPIGVSPNRLQSPEPNVMAAFSR